MKKTLLTLDKINNGTLLLKTLYSFNEDISTLFNVFYLKSQIKFMIYVAFCSKVLILFDSRAEFNLHKNFNKVQIICHGIQDLFKQRCREIHASDCGNRLINLWTQKSIRTSSVRFPFA